MTTDDGMTITGETVATLGVEWVARKTQSREAQERGTCRTSVTLPAELHHELEAIAKQKKVSLAWVIRDAAELYVRDKWPLLAEKG